MRNVYRMLTRRKYLEYADLAPDASELFKKNLTREICADGIEAKTMSMLMRRNV